MKPPDSKNAKKSITFGYFSGKICMNTSSLVLASPATHIPIPKSPT
jgi:hypothetical protein